MDYTWILWYWLLINCLLWLAHIEGLLYWQWKEHESLANQTTLIGSTNFSSTKISEILRTKDQKITIIFYFGLRCLLLLRVSISIWWWCKTAIPSFLVKVIHSSPSCRRLTSSRLALQLYSYPVYSAICNQHWWTTSFTSGKFTNWM